MGRSNRSAYRQRILCLRVRTSLNIQSYVVDDFLFCLCRYIGEIITDFEADQREDDSYLFDLDNKVKIIFKHILNIIIY